MLSGFKILQRVNPDAVPFMLKTSVFMAAEHTWWFQTVIVPRGGRLTTFVVRQTPRNIFSKFLKIWPFWQTLSHFGSEFGNIVEYIQRIS